MTFKDYFKQTKETSKRMIFHSFWFFFVILETIIILTKYDTLYSFINILKYLKIGVVFSFFISIFLLFIAVTSSYFKAKSSIDFYNSISDEISKEYTFYLQEKEQNLYYNFLDFELIMVDKNGIPFEIKIIDRNIWIVIFNRFDDFDDFQIKRLDILKKYKNEKIELIGSGLKKTISKKEWKNITEHNFRNVVNRLKSISEFEGLEFLNIETNLKIKCL